jgi:hypothetical protein
MVLRSMPRARCIAHADGKLGTMILRFGPGFVLVFCLISVAPVWAADYGSATEVAAVRKAVPQSVPSSAGACAVHANRIVVVGSYALIAEFFSDPCGGGGDELWAKRDAVWVDVAAGKPMIEPCDMKSKGVPGVVILQLLSHYRGPAAVAQAQTDLKNCPH